MLVSPCIIEINEEENKSCDKETEVNSDAIRKIDELYAWRLLYLINTDDPRSEVLTSQHLPWVDLSGREEEDMSFRIYVII